MWNYFGVLLDLKTRSDYNNFYCMFAFRVLIITCYYNTCFTPQVVWPASRTSFKEKENKCVWNRLSRTFTFDISQTDIQTSTHISRLLKVTEVMVSSSYSFLKFHRDVRVVEEAVTTLRGPTNDT